MIYRPNIFTWIATGIRPKMSAEMLRRTCRIELNPEMADTARRTYRHADLGRYIEENRGVALGHLITLVRWWQNQGSPLFTERELSSYENWSRIMGGILASSGVAGFLDNMQSTPPDMAQTRQDELLRAFAVKFADDEPTPEIVFNWSEDCGYRISEGRTSEDRREGFLPALLVLHGRTVEIEGKAYGFHHKQDKDKGFVFGTHLIEREAE